MVRFCVCLGASISTKKESGNRKPTQTLAREPVILLECKIEISNRISWVSDMKGIFLDIETTGLDTVRHRPIDLALKVIDCASGRLLAEYQTLILLSPEEWAQSDPESLIINGYTWEQIQSGKSKDVVAQELINLFTHLGITRNGAFFICQNPAFDRGFFTQIVPVYTQEAKGWPYHWLDFQPRCTGRNMWKTFKRGEAR